MRSTCEIETISATLLVGLVAVASILMTSSPGASQDAPPARGVSLSQSDRVAALENVQYALTELGDGASYVWHRGNGRLSGVIQPTSSFVDAKGRVCRHIVVLLSAGEKSRKTEAVACRLGNGVWRFDS
ncbi:MAG: hypothetical protein KJ587_13615 [Alphaproteobacteria bacterium]|nr:hypothetical protein [Alphaproteobacteria bacterium]